MALEDPNFNLLVPLSVTETELLSGIPDAENQTYDAGTTYAVGELVWHGGNVWRSLQDSNTGNTPVEGAWWTDLGAVDEGALEYSAGTTYNINDYAVYEGQLWKCAANSTTGVTPAVTATEWTRQGATNRLKAFDGFLQDVAVFPEAFSYTLSFPDLVTDVAILRSSGSSVNVTMTDDTEGEVFNQDFALIDDSAIVDWWAYFFAPILQIDNVLVTLPPYAGSDIVVTFTGETVEVGQMIFGAGLALGSVKTGTSVGIESYSLKDRDDFNRSLVVARPYSDTVSFDLAIGTQQVGYVKRQLAVREALPTLYYMRDGAAYGAIAYGFFKDFDILHGTPFVSDCVLEIEGLG